MFKDKYRETFSDIKADNKLKEKTKRICKNGGVTDMRKRINKAAVAVAACAAIFCIRSKYKPHIRSRYGKHTDTWSSIKSCITAHIYGIE